MDRTLLTVGLAAVSIGVASHVLWFHRGEHHLQAPQYAQALFLSFIGSIVGLWHFALVDSIGAALGMTFFTFGSFLFGALGSTLVYRLFLNPLNKFPGPYLARISSLFLAFNIDPKKENLYRVLEELHRRYGPYVRIGSYDLSITDPVVQDFAYAAGSPVGKGPWYDALRPLQSVHANRDPALHSRRRRVWSPGFSDKALRNYEIYIKDRNDKLVEIVGQNAGKPMDVQEWFGLYSFDMMGYMAFGKEYGMLEAGKRPEEIEIIDNGQSAQAPRLPSWLFQCIGSVPGVKSDLNRAIAFCVSQLRERCQRRDDDNIVRDVTGWILKSYGDVPHPEDDPLFQGDMFTLVVAGSETTAAALTFLFSELAAHPAHQKKLRDELRTLLADKLPSNWSDIDLRHAEHLHAVINETLRLYPGVPSGVQRMIPEGPGMRIGDVFLPGGTTMWMPPYVISRDEANYEQATSFIPERWTTRPKLMRRPEAFAPFIKGPYHCIGQNLALTEMRTLTTQIVLNYDVTFAPGENLKKATDYAKDHFTLQAGQIRLIFTPIQ